MMFFHPCRDVCQAAWDPCSYHWIIWLKWEIELCVISIAMVGEAMCLYDGTQWCSVCGEEEGSKNWSLGNARDQLLCFGYFRSLGHPERTDQWDRIQTSEVESQRCPVMRKRGGYKSIMKMFNFKSPLLAKIEAIIHNNAYSSEKFTPVVLSH